MTRTYIAMTKNYRVYKTRFIYSQAIKQKRSSTRMKKNQFFCFKTPLLPLPVNFYTQSKNRKSTEILQEKFPNDDVEKWCEEFRVFPKFSLVSISILLLCQIFILV